jgi:rhodanese-related sulfurtransferase
MRELSPVAAAALRNNSEVQFLDVREDWEHALCHIAGDLHIPMGQIPARLSEIPLDRPLIVVCHHGMRSRQVGEFLLSQGYADVTNLQGGIDAWARSVDTALELY